MKQPTVPVYARWYCFLILYTLVLAIFRKFDTQTNSYEKDIIPGLSPF